MTEAMGSFTAGLRGIRRQTWAAIGGSVLALAIVLWLVL